MRERDMRARIDGLLSRRLRAMVAPPALSLGLALAAGCKAHVPERRACTVYDFDDDAASSPCVASRPEGVAIYSAPAPPDGESDSSAPLAPPPSLFKPRPETSAGEIAAAIERCDLSTLRAAILSHDELSSISRTPPDATAYEELVGRWLAGWSLTDCTPAQLTTDPARRQPTIKSVVNVPAGTEWKAPLAIVAIALPRLARTGADPSSQIKLVGIDGRWRILLP